MFIPLVDVLRCVRAHEETWLVASIERAEERDIKEGFLGCPTCLAEYQVRDGVVYFVERDIRDTAVLPSESDAMKLAAALDLTEPRMNAVLQGRWAAHAQLVRAFSPSALLLLDPAVRMASGEGISIIVSDIAPFAAASMHAIAMDDTMTDERFVSLRRALRAGGRLLAPVALPIPDGFTELARDDEIWVARLDDTTTVSAPVPITLRSRTTSR